MKPCRGRGQQKPLEDFYAAPNTKDGFASKCKECAKAIVRAARKRNAEHYKEFDRARAMRDDRVAARAAYRKTEVGKAAVRRANLAYHSRAPERRAAAVALNNAIKSGSVVPWPACCLPDCDDKPEAHHPDYSRPLDVVWLCPTHHKQIHAMARKS